jgi:uncharacterized iron-regulated membrane protein
MVRLRRILFWVHLAAGVAAGVVILLMSVTGTLLTFQQAVLASVERPQRVVRVPANPQRLDLDAILGSVRAAAPHARPASLTIEADPAAAIAVSLGAQGTMFVNPYTGDVLGTGSARARAFYRAVTNWHRWLAREGDQRATGRAITGACNTAFLVLAVTGLYLWWPRQLTWPHIAAVAVFRRGLRGKARDFNWHNVIGFWCAPVLVVLTASGMVISYPWASSLVYTLTGSPRPAAAAREQPREGARADRGVRPAAAADAPDGAALERLVARAAQRLPTWETQIVRLPLRAGGPVAIAMSDGDHWNGFARSTLTFDGASGAELRWEPYAQSSLGQKARGWLRFAHTGELGGLPGEAIAGAASLGGAFLAWTGIALAVRRCAAWRARRHSSSRTETPAARVA